MFCPPRGRSGAPAIGGRRRSAESRARPAHLPYANVTASLPDAGAATEWPIAATLPAGWLLENAGMAVRARAVLDVARVGDAGTVGGLAYAHAPALRLALAQRRDGTWNGAMLSTAAPDDPTFAGVGTVPAVRRLLEYGWHPDSPPLASARRVLFRLLAEDADPAYLFELRDAAGTDEATIRRGRLLLREGAAAALAHMGFESDPRLRGAATRLLDRVSAYLRTLTPGERLSAGVLAADAAPPSAHLLTMLAFMPHFRSEHQYEVDRVLAFISEPAPSGAVRQKVGEQVQPQPHLVLGDPLTGRDVLKKDLPATLAWLETFARLGFLRRNEAWGRVLEQLLEQRDANGLWKRAVAPASAADPFVWPTFPLGDPGEPSTWPADVTFRLALVARLAGRRVEIA
jgi:hypothetical protein